jgi:hypothetical protein
MRAQPVEPARSRRQPAPSRASIAPASSGLACISQRRGVTPFVTLMNRSGKIRA